MKINQGNLIKSEYSQFDNGINQYNKTYLKSYYKRFNDFFCHPFTAPLVSPEIKYLFKNKYTISIGMIAIEAPAIIRLYEEAPSPVFLKLTTPTISVC